MYKSLKDASEGLEAVQDTPKEVKVPEKVLTIGDKRYEITFLPASDGITMAKEIVKLITPVLGSLVDGTKNALEFGDSRVFSDAAIYFCSDLDKADIVAMIKALLNNLKVNGKPVSFDEAFAANYGELVEVVKFAMEGNFSSFFTSKALTATLADLLKLLSKDQSQTVEPLEK